MGKEKKRHVLRSMGAASWFSVSFANGQGKQLKPAIAAMHGPHSVFDIGHCTVIHRDGGGVSLVDQ